MANSVLPEIIMPSFETSSLQNKRLACDRCRAQKLRCPRSSQSSQDGLDEPCVRCQRAGRVCIYGQRVKSGRPPKGSKDKSYLLKDFGRIGPRPIQEQPNSDAAETEHESVPSNRHSPSFSLDYQALSFSEGYLGNNDAAVQLEENIPNQTQSRPSQHPKVDDIMPDASSFPYSNMENFAYIAKSPLHDMDNSDPDTDLAKLNDGEYELSIDPDLDIDWGNLLGNVHKPDHQTPMNFSESDSFQSLFELNMKLLNWVKAYKPTLPGKEFNLLRDGETAGHLVEFSGEFIDIYQKSLPCLLREPSSFRDDIRSQDVESSTESSSTLSSRSNSLCISSSGVLFSMISCYTQILNVFELVLDWQKCDIARRHSDAGQMPAVGKLALKASIITHTIRSFFLHLHELSSTLDLSLAGTLNGTGSKGGHKASLWGLTDWEAVFPYEINTRSILGLELCRVKIQEEKVFAEIYRLENI